jgi:hypothetical protein
VGLDAEGWNMTGAGTKALIYGRNIGDFKIADISGGNAYSAVSTGAFDIDAQNITFLNKNLNSDLDLISAKANLILLMGNGKFNRGVGTITGFSLLGNMNSSNAINYNEVEQITTMSNSTDITKITNSILGPQYTPWTRPTWETLPDPLGANWKTDRVGKLDSTSYIQGLINSNGIAELPEGIFYISSTLKIPIDSKHGIVGQGTGKTVIVGLKDDFPLISLTGGQDANFIMAHLTLQGGSVGIYASPDYGTQHMAYQNFQFIVFRDQTYGVQLHQINGFDNNFLENLGFVNCTKGFFQDPLIPSTGIDYSSFVDKTMFYKNQFINCETAVYMQATRADNLDAWVDCKFNGGKTALAIGGINSPFAANCDFTNYIGGKHVINGEISLYNSNFNNNTPTVSMLGGIRSFIEGCTFLDSAEMYVPIVYNGLNHYIVNSTITGNVVLNIPQNQGFYPMSAVFSNSKLLANPTLSKMLVNIKNNVPTVIINSTPNPYPQLLVTQ